MAQSTSQSLLPQLQLSPAQPSASVSLQTSKSRKERTEPEIGTEKERTLRMAEWTSQSSLRATPALAARPSAALPPAGAEGRTAGRPRSPPLKRAPGADARSPLRDVVTAF